MIFNSLAFVVFLVLVFISYWWLLRRYQNLVLLISSYIFYAWWDWRFLFLLIGYTFIDYYLGLKIFRSSDQSDKIKYLTISISVSLILLGFFKYFNFFIDSLRSVLTTIGIPELSLTSLNVMLPLGISFFIFKSIGYTIEIYRGNFVPTKSLSAYMTFLSFFPQIASGPIDRAPNFLPQLNKIRTFDQPQITDGFRQILWGFFKKIVIADSLAIIVNRAFNSPEMFSGGELLLATLFFAFQIYADFSGYSDIANGISKLFGFRSVKNFEYPYFSRSITEFWRRWHISLSTWLRDYFYYPLVFCFKNKNKYIIYFSTITTFVLVGFWHGAGWNFIIMGGIFGCYIVFETIIYNLIKK